ANTVRPAELQVAAAAGLFELALKRLALDACLGKTTRPDYGRRYLCSDAVLHDRNNRIRRHRNDRKIRQRGQFAQTRIALQSANFRPAGIDWPDRALETEFLQESDCETTEVAFAIRSPDHADRACREQRRQVPELSAGLCARIHLDLRFRAAQLRHAKRTRNA